MDATDLGLDLILFFGNWLDWNKYVTYQKFKNDLKWFKNNSNSKHISNKNI